MSIALKNFSWERMAAAVDAVHERACRATAALQQAGIPHLIVGGNAVAAWVSRVDIEAVRNTKDVDVLLRSMDLDRAKTALHSVGFLYDFVNGVHLFLDGPEGSVRSAIHVIFAGERVRPDHLLPAPDVTASEPGPDYPVATLEALVRMKLIAYRLKDRVHLMDLLEVGLIDATWCEKLPPALAERMREVIADRERDQ